MNGHRKKPKLWSKLPNNFPNPTSPQISSNYSYNTANNNTKTVYVRLSLEKAHVLMEAKEIMKFRKISAASLFTIVFLSLAGNMLLLNFGTKVVATAPDYIPIKWALIVLGEFDYYHYPPMKNAIQKVEHWIQSEGVPYDIIPENSIETPSDTPTADKYPL